MIPIALFFALLLPAPRSNSTSQSTIEQQARASYEHHKQAAIRINNLANQIHSDADASTLVSQIAAIFANEFGFL